MTSQHARLDDLLALAAAGAATVEDVAELDRCLANAADADAYDDAYDDAAASIPLALEPLAPSAAVRVRLLEAVRSDAQGSSAASASPQRTPSPPPDQLAARRQVRRVGWVVAIAAAAALAMLWLGARGEIASLRADLTTTRADLTASRAVADQIRVEGAAAHAELASLRSRSDLLRSERVQLTTVSNDAGASCKIFIDPVSRRWVVFAHDLPPLPPNRTYQLWFVPATGAPISAGLLQRQPNGDIGAEVEAPAGIDVAKAAVSVEPAGGSAVPTMDQIQLIGDLI